MLKNEFNYYIVDKDKNIVFGPFDKNFFEVIKKEKGIKLEFVE